MSPWKRNPHFAHCVQLCLLWASRVSVKPLFYAFPIVIRRDDGDLSRWSTLRLFDSEHTLSFFEKSIKRNWLSHKGVEPFWSNRTRPIRNHITPLNVGKQGYSPRFYICECYAKGMTPISWAKKKKIGMRNHSHSFWKSLSKLMLFAFGLFFLLAELQVCLQTREKHGKPDAWHWLEKEKGMFSNHI